jgi:hypothetical protein
LDRIAGKNFSPQGNFTTETTESTEKKKGNPIRPNFFPVNPANPVLLSNSDNFVQTRKAPHRRGNFTTETTESTEKEKRQPHPPQLLSC